MNAFDILTTPWLIAPEKLSEIQEIYIHHLRGEKNIPGAIGTMKSTKVNTEGYDIQNGVAILSLAGLIFKDMNLLARILGGISSREVAQVFDQAFADSTVNSILLYIDSPGGSVEGTQELARQIFEARGQKPIIAYSDGAMNSAAYWIGSAADKVYISGDNVQVGSIGVVARHIDVSKADAMAGLKRTNIVAGRFKQIASEIEPLNELGKKTIQDAVDHVYAAFVGDVARFRKLSSVPVKDSETETIPWADGKVFMGRNSIDIGLVDGIQTLSEIIAGGGVIDPEILAKRAAIQEQVQAVLSGKAALVNSAAEPEVNSIFKARALESIKEKVEVHKTPIQTFDGMVKCFMALGLKHGEAIKKAVYEFPDLHEQYLSALTER